MSAASRGNYTLLGLLVFLVIWLGVEAIRTAEEQRHATDRVLNEYAGLAAWHFRTVWRAEWEAQGSYGPDAFPRVFGNYPLLPPALVGNLPNDSIVSIVVTRGFEEEPGETLWASPVIWPPTYRARVLEHPGERTLRFEAHLRPALATLLVPSRPRGARVLWLLTLFGATLALAGVVVAQIRREQQLVRARSDFVSSVSHELRTPLAQIRLFAESLKLGTARGPRDRAAALEVILQESLRLMHLVDNVLHFTRPGMRGRTPFPERVDLSGLVREVVQGFEPLARGQGIRFQVDAAEPVEVQLEPGEARQVLLNLLDNAVKFSPSGATVSLATRMTDGWAEITVCDQGPGVPADERERIWEPFVRLRADPSRAPGSGIGLAVVRDLVTRMDGEVSIRDAAGGGACFSVRIPALRTTLRAVGR